MLAGGQLVGLIIKTYDIEWTNDKLICFLEQSYFTCFEITVDISLLNSLIDLSNYSRSIDIVAEGLIDFKFEPL